MGTVDDRREQLRHLTDLATPFALRVVATLRIVDRLPATVDELATATGTAPQALGQVLRHLTAEGVLALSESGHHTPTELGELLRSDHPGRMRDMLDSTGGLSRSDAAFSRMLDAVRTGRAAYPLVFGTSFWADLEANPELGASFDAMLATRPNADAEELAHGYPWRGHVIDVGGGTGSQLVPVLRAHPDVRGTLVERPGPAAHARVDIAAAGLESRCSVQVGDFFVSLPPGDVYLLTHVLHNWNDDDCQTILHRCIEASGGNAAIAIVERLVAPSAAGATATDLRMLVTFGGRQRTFEELAALVARAGLVARIVVTTPRGLSLVECRKE